MNPPFPIAICSHRYIGLTRSPRARYRSSLGLNRDDVISDHRHDSVCDDLTMRRAALIGADLFPDSAVRAADSRTEQHREPVIAGEVAAVSLNVPTEINTLVAVGEYGGARPAAQAVARCAVLLIPDAAIVDVRRRMLGLGTYA